MGQAAYFSDGQRNLQVGLAACKDAAACSSINQRKLNFYMRALWGRATADAADRGTTVETRAGQPALISRSINVACCRMPIDTCFHRIEGIDLYRAAVAHAAAHLAYSDEACNRGRYGLSPCSNCSVDRHCSRMRASSIPRLSAGFRGCCRLWLQLYSRRPWQDSANRMRQTMQLSTHFWGIGLARLPDSVYCDGWIRLASRTILARGLALQHLDQEDQPRSLALEFGHRMP